MQIPKEHKFKVSGIAAQTLGVFSHTAVDPVSKIQYSTQKAGVICGLFSRRQTREETG